MNALAIVQRIVYELETPEQRCDAIRLLDSCEALLELTRYYNWDDGIAVPRAIIDHPDCDLGLALHVFELAEGIVWLTSRDDRRFQQEWARFCEDLSNRIQSGRYSAVSTPFDSSLTAAQQYKAKNDGVPTIFLSSIRPNKTKI